MNTNERDIIIAQLLNEGRSLSEVQKVLQQEHDIKLTYMELRLIAADLEVNWKKLDPEEKKPEPDAAARDLPPASGCRVSMSKVQRPGALFSGDVTFSSGATAEWFLDQFGRLGMNPTNGSDSPTEDDLREFQTELQGMIQGKI